MQHSQRNSRAIKLMRFCTWSRTRNLAPQQACGIYRARPGFLPSGRGTRERFTAAAITGLRRCPPLAGSFDETAETAGVVGFVGGSRSQIQREE